MKTAWLLVLMTVAGCSSPGAPNVLQVAPNQDDWEAAFSKLGPTEQASITRKPIAFVVAGLIDGTIYDIIDGNGSNQVDRDERLDIAAVCDGFNRAFGAAGADRWQIIQAMTFAGVSTPSGISVDRFDLKWTFRDATGRTLAESATDFGPGVKIIWGTSHQAIATEINQAFALTFLKMVVRLKNATSDR